MRRSRPREFIPWGNMPALRQAVIEYIVEGEDIIDEESLYVRIDEMDGLHENELYDE